ncbi:hypothetical protein K491DRAFT_708989 [Lophiostoma macrostomum CBS 122681]|uniref:Xylanolytic transcriptional activator regulatory domain-containing protein n=1 Tax=Lophiostoma macrostomum CBS 122681 TaxID=1314788 RepID=A0A6A6SJI8_9PLEO|nr:hypothetical protein K491DRAFT_708989 [Lophiostoma macrostomum CBS 122681]
MDREADASSQLSPDGERAAKRRRISASPTHPPREVGLMRNLPGDKFPSFVGSASGIHFIRSVYGSVRQPQPSSGAQARTPEKDIVPGEDDYLSSEVPGATRRLWKDDEVATAPVFHLDCQDLIGWSSSYFTNWHPPYPFLHAPTVLGLFEKLQQNGVPPADTHDNFEMITVRSIMSTSLADRRQSQICSEPRIPNVLVFETYDQAIGSLQRALSRPASVCSLQAALSVQVFLVSMLRLNAASRLGGLIIRMALQLGLHRCPNRFPSFSSQDRELRQRLFWSIYCIDRLICQSMGLPLSLRDDDIDVCYPSEERHQTPCSPSDTRLRCLEFLARHSEIRGHIMELRNKSIKHSQKETDEAVAITARLTRWWNDVEDFADSEPLVLSTYHRTVLTILYHESMISLNRPILALNRSGSAYDAALQHCLGSSRFIITTLYEMLSQTDRAAQQSSAITLLWPSFTWGVWMSTFIVFHAAHSKQISHRTMARLTERSSRILLHVSRRGSVWPDACASAIQHLRAHLLHGRASDGSEGHTPQSSSYAVPLETQIPDHVGQVTAGAPTVSRDESTRLRVNMLPTNTRHRSWRQDISTAPGAPNMTRSTPSPPNDAGVKEAWNTNFGHDGDTSESGVDPFAGFDIPFWLGQDEYAGLVNEWS